jgi:SWI/SNF-related matrix-associated actin-dependent regulator 1 of chromatin subfamily A
MKELFEYQKDGINWLTNRDTQIPKHSILGDDMGLGKTVQLISAAKAVNAKRILVLCPATIKINWMREFVAWSDYRNIFIVSTSKDIIPENTQVVICNYDLVIKKSIKEQILRFKYDVGIMDECHYLQSTESQRTKSVLARGGVIWACDYKWGATGTPMPNRPKNLYPILRSLAPYVIAPYTDYMDYAYRFCAGHMGAFGFDDTGCSHAEELGERLKPFMLRRLKEEVLAQLPEKTIQYIYLERTKEIQRVMDLEAQLSEEEINSILEFRALGSFAKIRNELAQAKLPQCIKIIKEQMTTLNKVVIGFYHREVLNRLKEALEDYGICVVTGGMTGEQKQREIDEFVNNPEKKIFLGQIQAAGVGVDGLQKVCSEMILVETSWVPGDIDQFVDRLRRIGQKNNVHIQVLTVPESLEEDIITSELLKRRNIKRVLKRIETTVSEKKTKTRKENKIMSLENEVARIANALEEIAGVLKHTPQAQSMDLDKANDVAVAKDDHKDDEREALLAKARAMGLPGKLGAMSADTLHKKIAEREALISMAPVETTPVETAPVETAPVETAPVEATPVVEAVKVATAAEVQKAAQELVKKIGAPEASAFVTGIIRQVGGDVEGRPAKLADLTDEQKAVVLDATNAKLAE